MTKPTWDFDYRPVLAAVHDTGLNEDLILATEGPVEPSSIGALLGQMADQVRVEPVLDRHPLYWTRVRFGAKIDRRVCERRLRLAGVAVRYLAPAQHGCQVLPPALDFGDTPPMAAGNWQVHGASDYDESATPGRWFMGASGIDVYRPICGTGAGTRLAVIDNDAGEVGNLDLDNQIPVGVDRIPRGSSHAAQLVSWAVRTGHDGRFPGFIGVAPDASPRLYSIPKPGNDVLSLPLAIVSAVADGADVVLCATYVDGQWSPMLDDALELAVRLGRNGRGAAVVLPCSRETSSPEGSVHPSLSLGVGEPAADPRVFCVAPSGRDGGWFLWRDRSGRLHPFANRGPALRWLAPGDDVALPFSKTGNMAHAESSGASAMAAGVLLLVLGQNPELDLSELDQVLNFTATEVAPEPAPERGALANRHDLLPVGRDRDGHNAKHGYGLLCASRACLLAADPMTSALVTMGEDRAAAAWITLRCEHHPLSSLYSSQLGRWAARVLLADASLRHALSTLARTIRLIAIRPERLRAQLPGALLRLCAMLLRGLAQSRHAPAPALEVEHELAGLLSLASDGLMDVTRARELEVKMCNVAAVLWPLAGSRAATAEWRETGATHSVRDLGA